MKKLVTLFLLTTGLMLRGAAPITNLMPLLQVPVTTELHDTNLIVVGLYAQSNQTRVITFSNLINSLMMQANFMGGQSSNVVADSFGKGTNTLLVSPIITTGSLRSAVATNLLATNVSIYSNLSLNGSSIHYWSTNAIYNPEATNTIRVETWGSDDLAATIQGYPHSTLTNAVAMATNGDTIAIGPGGYWINYPLLLPTNSILVGKDSIITNACLQIFVGPAIQPADNCKIIGVTIETSPTNHTIGVLSNDKYSSSIGTYHAASLLPGRSFTNVQVENVTTRAKVDNIYINHTNPCTIRIANSDIHSDIHTFLIAGNSNTFVDIVGSKLQAASSNNLEYTHIFSVNSARIRVSGSTLISTNKSTTTNGGYSATSTAFGILSGDAIVTLSGCEMMLGSATQDGPTPGQVMDWITGSGGSTVAKVFMHGCKVSRPEIAYIGLSSPGVFLGLTNEVPLMIVAPEDTIVNYLHATNLMEIKKIDWQFGDPYLQRAALTNIIFSINTNGWVGVGTSVATNAVDVRGTLSASNILLSGVSIVPTNANTIFVRKDGDNATAVKYRQDKPYSDISNALAAASVGDVVRVGPGVYGPIQRPLVVPKGVALVGEGCVLSNAVLVLPYGPLIQPLDNSVIGGSIAVEVCSTNGSGTAQYAAVIGSYEPAGNAAFTNVSISGLRVISYSPAVFINHNTKCEAVIFSTSLKTVAGSVGLTGPHDLTMNGVDIKVHGSNVVGTFNAFSVGCGKLKVSGSSISLTNTSTAATDLTSLGNLSGSCGDADITIAGCSVDIHATAGFVADWFNYDSGTGFGVPVNGVKMVGTTINIHTNYYMQVDAAGIFTASTNNVPIRIVISEDLTKGYLHMTNAFELWNYDWDFRAPTINGTPATRSLVTVIDKNGKVGIGTDLPQANLHVEGSVIANGMLSFGAAGIVYTNDNPNGALGLGSIGTICINTSGVPTNIFYIKTNSTTAWRALMNP